MKKDSSKDFIKRSEKELENFKPQWFEYKQVLDLLKVVDEYIESKKRLDKLIEFITLCGIIIAITGIILLLIKIIIEF